VSKGGTAHCRVSTQRGAYCYRRTAWICGASLLRSPWFAIHDFVPHAVSSVSALTLAHSDECIVPLSALVSWCRRELHGEHTDGANSTRKSRLRQPRALAAGSGYAAVPAAQQGVPAAPQTHCRLCRPRGNRKERRRLSADAVERFKDRHRRWSG